MPSYQHLGGPEEQIWLLTVCCGNMVYGGFGGQAVNCLGRVDVVSHRVCIIDEVSEGCFTVAYMLHGGHTILFECHWLGVY